MTDQIRTRRKFLGGAAAAGAGTLAFPMIARAQGPISMRWQSTWPSKDIFHEYALDFAKKVNDMTGGDMKIEVLPAGAVVPAFNLLDAVSKGTLDGGHGVVVYHYGKNNALALQSIGLFFPFLLAAILKSAQGSSTVAITTTAGIVAPLLPVLGLSSPALASLTVIAIGAGAMTVSHANDSYFWVVTNFGGMSPQDGYKTQTLGTLVVGLASMVGVMIVSLFLH